MGIVGGEYKYEDMSPDLKECLIECETDTEIPEGGYQAYWGNPTTDV